MFGSDRVDTFHGRENAHFLTQVAYADILFLHIAFRALYVTSDLEVGETKAFRLFQYILRKILDLVVTFQYVGVIHDILQALQEPACDL